ncbi:MAG: hypothetical protein VW362_04995 [Candidatus Nanopelagicales bacterium]
MSISFKKIAVGSAAFLAAVAVSIPAAAPASATASDPVVASDTDVAARASGAYTWMWSDGVTGRRRTFTKRDYGYAANLPYLVVEASCAGGARVGDVLKLQFQDYRGKWITEDRHWVADCNSIGYFEFNPYTSSGKWAVGAYKYRLIVSGARLRARFTIIYARR